MNRFKGPNLNLPELKVPPFLADLYYDLRDRRLLPLVALVIVAIVAAPILLSNGSEEDASSPAEGAGLSAAASGVQSAELAVVEAKPGLRDYRKRLKGRTPTDPFEQRYTGAAAASGQLTSESTTTSTQSTTTTTSTSAPSVSESPTAGSVPSSEGGDEDRSGSDAAQTQPAQVQLFTFALDVQIARTEPTPAGRQKMGEPTTRHGVLPTTPLPGEKAPVVTYMGLAPKGKKVLLMVSNNVTSIFGDAKCLSGTNTCQLLEVEPGFPQTFVYGDNDVRYKVNVLKVETVPTGRSESGPE